MKTYRFPSTTKSAPALTLLSMLVLQACGSGGASSESGVVQNDLPQPINLNPQSIGPAEPAAAFDANLVTLQNSELNENLTDSLLSLRVSIPAV